jgi:GT2 family glycosyltransferase
MYPGSSTQLCHQDLALQILHLNMLADSARERTVFGILAGTMTAPRPAAVLVVGMHRSGTSATASALAKLGLALPVAEDLLLGSIGNEAGHFESRSLLELSDKLLRHLGRSWDDPPERGEVERACATLLGRFGARARDTFEAAYDAPDSPVVWKDPRTSLLLPFWRAALERDLAAVLITRDPLEAARSLDRRDAIGLVTSLALWERYVLLALDGLEGMPTFVTEFSDSLASPDRWRLEVAAWLSGLGVPVTHGDAVLPFDAGLRHEVAAQRHDQEEIVLPEQRAIFETLAAKLGPRPSLEGLTLPGESHWTTAALRARHDALTFWKSCALLAPSLATAIVTAPPRERRPGSSEYPQNATEDEQAYHEWLRERGEPTTVGGPLTVATAPPAQRAEPRFSIVVPTYNTAVRLLDRCVASVLAQDLASYELILVDDASSDATLLERMRHLPSIDPRISVRFRSSNGGISAATNEGVRGARGEWVAFLDHDDELVPYALSRLATASAAHPAARLIYSDEDKIDESGRRHMPAFKPGWSPDLLLSNAYMCHLLAVRRDLLEQVGGLRSEFDGAQDYDLMLRATETLADEEIVHVPEILYHWRATSGSASKDPSAKPWAFEAGRRAVEAAVGRRGVPACRVDSHPSVPGSYVVRRRVVGRPLVSAIIPFRDEPAMLASCYRAFVADPGYDAFELLLVDNDSVLPETQAVLNELARDRRVRLIEAPGAFNWVKINNEAAGKARGDVLLFLNNDVEASSPGWLAEMVAHAQREEVGAVGARLLFPDGTLQHGGVTIGVCWGAAHVQQGLRGTLPGYLSAVSVTRNTSAVTGACLMTRRDVFEAAGGFDQSLPVAFNDIDYCLRLRAAGRLIVYTSLAELVHHESKTRGHTDDEKERPVFRRRWRDLILDGDPYYNPNLGRFDHYCRLPSKEDEERWQIFLSMLNESSSS